MWVNGTSIHVLEDHMLVYGPLLALFQYSGAERGYGMSPAIGLAIVIVAGLVAGACGRSGAGWGALVGAICFATGGALQAFYGDQPSLSHVLDQIGVGAAEGGPFGAIFGFFGGWIGRKLARQDVQSGEGVNPLGLSGGPTANTKPWRCGKCGALVTGEYCECGLRRAI